MVALVRKIERRLEPHAHVEQRLADRRQRVAQRAIELIERESRLRRCHRVDQIGDGFRLHQIELAVEEGAQRELARRRQARAGGHGAADDAIEQHRAAVRGDLDDVVAGVGRRRREPGEHHLIDRRAARHAAPASSGAARRRTVARRAPSAGPGARTAAIDTACGPAMRTTPRPARPGGVATATMVSSVENTALLPCPRRASPRSAVDR